MKTIRFIGTAILTGCIAVLLYANLRSVSPTERLKHVVVSTYAISPGGTSFNGNEIKQKVESTHGVTACTINERSRLAGIVYHPDLINEKELKSLLSSATGREVEGKRFEAKGNGCPVHQMETSISDFISLLDLRN